MNEYWFTLSGILTFLFCLLLLFIVLGCMKSATLPSKIMLLIEYATNVYYVGDFCKFRYLAYNVHVKEFEKRLQQWYPLDKDTMFCLDHGANYFTFFRRIGKPSYYCLFDKQNKIQATICFLLQRIYQTNEDVFYVCDLKFDKIIRGKGMLLKLLWRTIPFCLFSSRKFYAISMNDDDNDKTNENKILSMGQHLTTKNTFPKISIEKACVLNIYVLDYKQMVEIEETLAFYKNCAKIQYISLKGIKDLIVKNKTTEEESECKAMDLLHATYGNDDEYKLQNGQFYSHPLQGYKHMFCTSETSLLAVKLKDLDIYPDSHATVIHYNMDNYNWEFIQTCDI